MPHIEEFDETEEKKQLEEKQRQLIERKKAEAIAEYERQLKQLQANAQALKDSQKGPAERPVAKSVSTRATQRGLSSAMALIIYYKKEEGLTENGSEKHKYTLVLFNMKDISIPENFGRRIDEDSIEIFSEKAILLAEPVGNRKYERVPDPENTERLEIGSKLKITHYGSAFIRQSGAAFAAGDIVMIRNLCKSRTFNKDGSLKSESWSVGQIQEIPKADEKFEEIIYNLATHMYFVDVGPRSPHFVNANKSTDNFDYLKEELMRPLQMESSSALVIRDPQQPNPQNTNGAGEKKIEAGLANWKAIHDSLDKIGRAANSKAYLIHFDSQDIVEFALTSRHGLRPIKGSAIWTDVWKREIQPIGGDKMNVPTAEFRIGYIQQKTPESELERIACHVSFPVDVLAEFGIKDLSKFEKHVKNLAPNCRGFVIAELSLLDTHNDSCNNPIQNPFNTETGEYHMSNYKFSEKLKATRLHIDLAFAIVKTGFQITHECAKRAFEVHFVVTDDPTDGSFDTMRDIANQNPLNRKKGRPVLNLFESETSHTTLTQTYVFYLTHATFPAHVRPTAPLIEAIKKEKENGWLSYMSDLIMGKEEKPGWAVYLTKEDGQSPEDFIVWAISKTEHDRCVQELSRVVPMDVDIDSVQESRQKQLQDELAKKLKALEEFLPQEKKRKHEGKADEAGKKGEEANQGGEDVAEQIIKKQKTAKGKGKGKGRGKKRGATSENEEESQGSQNVFQTLGITD